MKIRITAGSTVLTATMNDSATSRDFISLLPQTLKITDYSSTEKISDLPKKLSTQGAPGGCKAAKGDITLYAPWGNLAIFYRDFGYASGLVCMGKVDGQLDDIKKLSGNVLFERID
ncbi:cyclophilin-like fold protein [Celerinatantimonas sp. YJH-8]|uniref:cyclophilin-like fold protein n=1 Tax=Celerinatantimonas sp. YJH-8 TaxID=3228714 RepID=UPI0038C82487